MMQRVMIQKRLRHVRNNSKVIKINAQNLIVVGVTA